MSLAKELRGFGLQWALRRKRIPGSPSGHGKPQVRETKAIKVTCDSVTEMGRLLEEGKATRPLSAIGEETSWRARFVLRVISVRDLNLSSAIRGNARNSYLALDLSFVDV